MKNSQDMIKQYLNSQVDYSDIKTAELNQDLSAVKKVNQAEIDSEQELSRFKQKLKVFDGVDSITKAKELAKEFLPINKEKNYLKIGDAKCVIILRGDLFRICLDSETEYICYNIIKSQHSK